MINMSKIPQDCSVETLFPGDYSFVFRSEPVGYALQSGGPGGIDIKIPFWDVTFDPCEDNIQRSDGIIEHDNYMILTKWLIRSPTNMKESLIVLRYRKTDLYKY